MALTDSQRQAIAAIDGPQPEAQAPQGGAAPQQKNTAESAAQQSGAPKNEAAQMSENPFIEIDYGNGQKRQMTHSEIAGITSRYAALNHRNATLKPVTDVIESFLRDNPNMSPGQLAQELQQLAAGQQPNVQFGRGGINDPDGNGMSGQGQGQSKQQAKPASADDFDRWENDNASSLPPGYREMHTNMSQMMQALQQQNQMMRQLLGASAGQVDAARMAQQGATQQRSQSIQQSIGNNLDRAQQQLQLPSEAANDFMAFASNRGYSLEDFADPQLTMMVMQDFKNNMASPEMDRLRQIHQRRTAFVSQGGGAPGGAASQPDPQQADFAEFAGRQMQKRM